MNKNPVFVINIKEYKIPSENNSPVAAIIFPKTMNEWQSHCSQSYAHIK